MNIRKTELKDLEKILEIYKHAREQMKLNGNPTQWGDNNPKEETLVNDINNKVSYVVEKDNKIVGVFTFIIGEDDTYKVIEEGSWLNDKLYGTIHRIASNNEEKGIFEVALKYVETLIDNIRIDTHQNNLIMQHLILKNGFTKCGIIYVDDGTPRIAYQKEVK